MVQARQTAINILKDLTHGGERVRVFQAPHDPAEDGPRLPGDCDMAILDAFVRARKEHVRDFQVGELPADLLEVWRLAANSESNSVSDDMYFHGLEELVRFLRTHIMHLTLYNVIIEKCDAGTAATCAWCSTHPRRGTFSFRALRANPRCPEDSPCSNPSFCKHATYQNIHSILEQLKAATPSNLRPVRRCGICKQEGHDRRRCPQNPDRASNANVPESSDDDE
jgi:hypothetical protein